MNSVQPLESKSSEPFTLNTLKYPDYTSFVAIEYPYFHALAIPTQNLAELIELHNKTVARTARPRPSFDVRLPNVGMSSYTVGVESVFMLDEVREEKKTLEDILL